MVLPRSSRGQFASKDPPVANAKSASTQRQQHHHPYHREIADSDSDAFDSDDRPAKKRKLSIRHKQQTTLDHFAFSSQSGHAKPPTKVTVTQPHGQLIETLNGVQTALDVNEDELGGDNEARPTPVRLPEQPAKAAEKKEDKRTLRSHDEGPRLKSELAVYFPNFEDVILDVQKEEDFITVDSVLYVTDDATKQQPGSSQSSPEKARGTPSHHRNGSVNGTTLPTTPQRSSSNQFNGCSPIDIDVLARNLPDNPEDPLTDDYYLKSHRRAERKEKQLRNIERERAMHEKVQLEQILDRLQGHDWLKVLGITGITDGEAKKYEPKRDYFIAEVQSLVDKFKEWKEQEKRQRLEREAARVAESEERETEEGSVEPPSSDLNASASRQLQQETANAVRSGFTIKLSNKRKDGPSAPTSAPSQPPPVYMPPPPPPEVPISSFYAKRHLRDAALGKARHGRNVTAFGHPIPDMEERDFELPEDYATEDAIRANARERRRRKRASIADAASGG